MPITTLSSRELNQDSSRAKKTAEHGPVLSRMAATPHMCCCASRSTGG